MHRQQRYVPPAMHGVERLLGDGNNYHSTQVPSHVGPALIVIQFPRQRCLTLPPLGITSRFPAIALGSSTSTPGDASLATAVKSTAADLSVTLCNAMGGAPGLLTICFSVDGCFSV